MSLARLERLRAARLHRQAASGLDALVAEQVGLHSTDYATPYLSAWARLPDFEPRALFDRLNRGDGLVRVNAFRNTVHVVRTADLATISAATGAGVAASGRRSPALKGRSDDEIRAGVDALVAALGDGPLGTNELKARLPALARDLRFWLLVALGAGEVIRADAVHARSNRTRWALARSWVPGFVPGEVPAADARRDVLRRAVAAFGPVTVEDLAWWLPAPKREVVAALAGLPSVEAEGRRYWFPEGLDEGRVDRSSLGAWALPYEDALLKGSLARDHWLAPGLRAVVFPYDPSHWSPPDGTDPGPGPHRGANASGEARPTLWWNGRVVGRWEERGERIAWQLHADVGAEGRDALAATVARLERFFAERLRPLC